MLVVGRCENRPHIRTARISSGGAPPEDQGHKIAPPTAALIHSPTCSKGFLCSRAFQHITCPFLFQDKPQLASASGPASAPGEPGHRRNRIIRDSRRRANPPAPKPGARGPRPVFIKFLSLQSSEPTQRESALTPVGSAPLRKLRPGRARYHWSQAPVPENQTPWFGSSSARAQGSAPVDNRL